MPQSFDFGPWPPLAYVNSRLERASERRNDHDYIESAIRHSTARAVIISGERVVLRKRGTPMDVLFAIDEARSFGVESEPVFLGLANDAPRFGFSMAPDAAERLKTSDLLVIDLRSIVVQGLLAQEDLQPIAVAKALLTWHAKHRFCANCGAPTQSSEAGWRRDCGSCGAQHFPRTDPCVIMLAIDGERCLLARSARFPQGMWSCLAGFVEPGETLEEAVRRETREEAGVQVGRVVYFSSQPWPFPMSIMIGCHAEATATKLRVDPNEIEDARWVPRAEAALMLERKHKDGLSTPPPAAVAYHLIRAYVERGPDVLREIR
ncbi:MAG TPA: NAD(+) diphosphatase [Xanthobacteraceae bacterium]|jgi:NAD+ diphosphatase